MSKEPNIKDMQGTKIFIFEIYKSVINSINDKNLLVIKVHIMSFHNLTKKNYNVKNTQIFINRKF